LTWFRRNWQGLEATGTVALDVAALLAATAIAYVVRFRLGWGPELASNRFLFFVPVNLTFTVASVLAGLALGLYTRHRTAGPLDRVVRALGAVTVGALLTVAATFFVIQDRLEFVRLLVAYMWLSGIVLVVVGRSLLIGVRQALNRFGIGVTRVVVVGAGTEGTEVLARLFDERTRRFQVVGLVDDFATSVTARGHRVPVLGRVDSLAGVLSEHQVDKVVVAIPSLSHDALLGILEQTEASFTDVWLLPDLFQLMVSPVTTGGIRGLPLMAVNEVRLQGLSRLTKRSLDLAGAMFGMVLLSIPMMLVALAIRLDSAGPVFYVQQRVGRDQRRFPIVKFRTMHRDAELSGQTWTIANDPRITRVGRVLRRYWIDELPQLINVIRGDMSLVGPRPERTSYVRQFEREYSRYMVRHRERAGMTGWAQVNGLRGNSSIDERTRYDLYYVENWSLLFDFRILMRTLRIMVRGDVA
jgi:exopolysaccharide biosynthesis polyprenyl glycosylphosphotransferase